MSATSTCTPGPAGLPTALPLGPLLLLRLQEVQGALGIVQDCARHVGVDLGGRRIIKKKKNLDDADVGAALEQMRGEGVTQAVKGHRVVDPGLASRLLE